MRLTAIIIFCLAVPAIGFSATLLVPSQFPTIQGAITAAVNGDTVLVSPGTYVENIDFLGKAITVTSVQGPEVTIIDGNQGGSVVKFNNSGASNSILDGFTITNGSAIYGSGIYCNLSSPTIRNNIISGNSTSGSIYRHGGGLYCRQGSPTITGNTISGNSASGEGGGMIFVISCNPSIEDNIITDNSAERWGGGIEFYDSCSPTIINNTITNNTVSQYGGGGIVMASNCSGTITNNTIIGNSANHSGGIYCENGTSPLMIGNTVASNTAQTGNSGGIYCRNNCQPVCMDCVFADNAAGFNGGAFMVHTSCDATLVNCLFIGNSSENWGGAIRIGALSNATLANCTFYGNSALNAGGAFAAGSDTAGPINKISMVDCILWENTAPLGAEIALNGLQPAELTISYSDVKGGKALVYVQPPSILNWDSGMIDANPLFCTGPKGFYYLSQDPCQPGTNNPCVNTGSALASNLGMDVYWTRTDEVTDSGMVDMGFHYGDFAFPSLQADTFAISQSVGGKTNLLLLAGSANANRNYIMLGCVTGTDPGTPLPGGQATLPLNWDIFTNLVLSLIKTPVCSNFMGTLDPVGRAEALFDTLGPFTGGAGLTLYFAYALSGPWDFASNPVAVEILP